MASYAVRERQQTFAAVAKYVKGRNDTVHEYDCDKAQACLESMGDFIKDAIDLDSDVEPWHREYLVSCGRIKLSVGGAPAEMRRETKRHVGASHRRGQLGRQGDVGSGFMWSHKVLCRLAIVWVMVFAGAGCATTLLPVYEPTSAHKLQAMELARRTAMPPSRRTPRAELVAVAERVRQRMWPAGLTVCREVFATNCPESLASMRVMVWLDEGNINAFAREDGVLGFNGA